jgi:hypothetical protein
MPIITIKELSDLTGIPPKNIHTYISRGKLIQRKDKLIDDTVQVNADFIAKYRKIKSELIETPVLVTESAKKQPKKTQPESENKPESEQIYYSENKLRQLKGEKLNEDIKLAKLRNDKIEGKLIPTDIIQRAIQEVIQRYKMTFVQQSEQLIRDLLNELQAGNEIITKACTKNIEISNAAFTRAIFESKQAIKNSISESLSINN